MRAAFLHSVDWHQPWLMPYRHVGQALAQADDWREKLNVLASGIRNGRGLPVRFVPQSSLPPETAYEAFISHTGQVPTRENLHDFFNALVWLSFPRLKVQLNARQAAEIERMQGCHAGGGQRGPVRDAATLFDENAALLVARNVDMLDMLRDHQWQTAFLDRRQQFQGECAVFLFGHALMEKLVAPYKAITAHAVPIVGGDAFFELSLPQQLDWLDRTVARQVAARLDRATFTPLPVLGVPGWWEGQDAGFYADTTVFRPRRQRRQ